MTDSVCGINSLADRRYYHFVVVKGGGLTLPAYWRRLDEIGRVERPRVQVPVDSQRFVLEHRKLRYEVAFARGSTAEYLSQRGDGRAPFLYDLFAARMDFQGESYLLFGFPFNLLALDVIASLEGKGFFKNAEYQNVNLTKWLASKNRPFKKYEGLGSNVVNVQFLVMDDTSLTKVRLGGQDPFGAEIYEEFLKPRFEGGSLVPNLCVLACDREVDLKVSLGKVLHSRLHIDQPGNFKFYMHTGCANATLLPYAIGQIHTAKCLKNASSNPLKKVEQDESE
jgi:hypothetical protein